MLIHRDEDERKLRRTLVEQLFVAVDSLRAELEWIVKDAVTSSVGCSSYAGVKQETGVTNSNGRK